jgi:hypothetical protein
VNTKLPVDAFPTRFFTSRHSILYDAPVSSGAPVTNTTSEVGLGRLGFGAGARFVVSAATFPGARLCAAVRSESARRAESAACAESLGAAARTCVLSQTIADSASLIGTAVESDPFSAKSDASILADGSSGLSKRARSVTESTADTWLMRAPMVS